MLNKRGKAHDFLSVEFLASLVWTMVWTRGRRRPFFGLEHAFQVKLASPFNLLLISWFNGLEVFVQKARFLRSMDRFLWLDAMNLKIVVRWVPFSNPIALTPRKTVKIAWSLENYQFTKWAMCLLWHKAVTFICPSAEQQGNRRTGQKRGDCPRLRRLPGIWHR